MHKKCTLIAIFTLILLLPTTAFAADPPEPELIEQPAQTTPQPEQTSDTARFQTSELALQSVTGFTGMVVGGTVGFVGAFGMFRLAEQIGHRPTISPYSNDLIEALLGHMAVGMIGGLGLTVGTGLGVTLTGHALGGTGTMKGSMYGAVAGMLTGPLAPIGIPIGAVAGYHLSADDDDESEQTDRVSMRPHVDVSTETSFDEPHRMTLGVRGQF